MTGRLAVILGVAIALLVACADTRPTADATTPELEPSDAVWRIVATACGTQIEGLATAVAVADDLVVTVAHTFEGAESAQVTGADGMPGWAADVVYLDPERDLAVLRLKGMSPGETLRWLPLGDSSDGDEVTVITAAGDQLQAKTARVIRHVDVTLDGDGRRAGLELEAEISRGDSGSPVVNADGAIAGIVFAADRDEAKGWAVAATEVEAALAQLSAASLPLDC